MKLEIEQSNKSASVTEKYDIRIVQYWTRFGAQTHSLNEFHFIILNESIFHDLARGKSSAFTFQVLMNSSKIIPFSKKLGYPIMEVRLSRTCWKKQTFFAENAASIVDEKFFFCGFQVCLFKVKTVPLPIEEFGHLPKFN